MVARSWFPVKLALFPPPLITYLLIFSLSSSIWLVITLKSSSCEARAALAQAARGRERARPDAQPPTPGISATAWMHVANHRVASASLVACELPRPSLPPRSLPECCAAHCANAGSQDDQNARSQSGHHCGTPLRGAHERGSGLGRRQTQGSKDPKRGSKTQVGGCHGQTDIRYEYAFCYGRPNPG